MDAEASCWCAKMTSMSSDLLPPILYIAHTPHSRGYACMVLSKAVTRGVFGVFEHPRNFREKLDTQKQIYY